MRVRAILGSLLVTMALGATAVAAQPSDAAAAQMSAVDAKAIDGHRLSVDLVKRATAVNVALKKAEKADPELGKTLSDDVDDSNNESIIDELVKDLESAAWQAAALKSARITARDYVLTLIVATRAQLTIEMTANGTLKDPVPPGMTRNIAFVKAHPAEIKAFDDSAR